MIFQPLPANLVAWRNEKPGNTQGRQKNRWEDLPQLHAVANMEFRGRDFGATS